MTIRRITPNIRAVARALLETPAANRYGLVIARATEQPGGTVYPILQRMIDDELLRDEWEVGDPRKLQRPLRRMLLITSKGQERLKEIALMGMTNCGPCTRGDHVHCLAYTRPMTCRCYHESGKH